MSLKRPSPGESTVIHPTDQIAIFQLYETYNRAIDEGALRAWIATFTPDGVFDHPARAWKGQEGLMAFFEQRESSLQTSPITQLKHWNSNIAIVVDAHHTTATCELLVSGVRSQDSAPVVVALGQYRDSLIKTDQGWRFQVRKLAVF